MPEAPEHRLKRLGMRSWRRGTKEMDLILGPYSDEVLDVLDPDALNAYEALLGENDQDLYAWITGQIPEPPAHGSVIAEIRAFHKID
ncbi:MAG: succinate dehydrogenase assembly factor 2 [Pseudomonadota bacterium]